jgi:hypothetical protein
MGQGFDPCFKELLVWGRVPFGHQIIHASNDSIGLVQIPILAGWHLVRNFAVLQNFPQARASLLVHGGPSTWFGEIVAHASILQTVLL